MKYPKEWRTLVRHAEASGWRVTYTGSGHVRFEGPAGQLVFASSTPSDAKRALKNTELLLRRRGLPPARPDRKRKT